MANEPGHEPIEDEEVLYRRIPVSKRWYDGDGLSPEAFQPRDDEVTGISIYRAKYKTLEQAAVGKAKQGYYVALLLAGKIRQHGIEVVPRPGPGDPGHSELPGLTCNNRDTAEAIERMATLCRIFESVEGPFVPPAAVPKAAVAQEPGPDALVEQPAD